jgi:hypothetical protein
MFMILILFYRLTGDLEPGGLFFRRTARRLLADGRIAHAVHVLSPFSSSC